MKLLRIICTALLASIVSFAAQAQIEISDPPIGSSFGRVPLGTGSATQYYSLTNIGNSAVALGQATVAPQGVCVRAPCDIADAAKDFVLDKGTDGCSNITLAPGASCSSLVVFTPSLPGSRNARLLFPRGANLPAVSYEMVGTGILNPADCVFDWAQRTFPEAIKPAASTIVVGAYMGRCYQSGALCLAADLVLPPGLPQGVPIAAAQVYAYIPAANPPIQPLGPLSTFAAQANCILKR